LTYYSGATAPPGKKFRGQRVSLFDVIIIDLARIFVKLFFKKIAFIFSNNQGQIGAAK